MNPGKLRRTAAKATPAKSRARLSQDERRPRGAEGTGTKFVYVFDRSGSMEGYGGRPLASAKHQLISSLTQLNDACQFQIIFYNEQPEIFRPDVGTPQAE